MYQEGGGENLLKGKLVPPLDLSAKQHEMQNVAFFHGTYSSPF